MLSVDHAWVLPLLILCVPALRGQEAAWVGISSLLRVPEDPLSLWVDRFLRVLAALAIACIVLGLAGLHEGARSIARSGRGAHIVLVLDRSLSMDEAFARTGEKARMSKTVAAAQMIEAFFASRPHDSFGVLAFSTQPIAAMPLTDHREAVAATMAAMAQKALANTDIGAALESAISLFVADDPAATRVLFFVSDGAGHIPENVQADLRTKMLLQRIHLYYLYLRSGDAPPLQGGASNAADTAQPAELDAFFRSLGVPYRAFEAENPGAITSATDAINRLETHPIAYWEKVPRVDLQGPCYLFASFCLAALVLASLAERDFAAPWP